MIKKNALFNTIISVLILVNIITCFNLFFNLGKIESKQITASHSDSGKIQIQVLEENTNKPIDGATICVIETRHYEKTNKYGRSSLIEIPIIRNTNYDFSLERKWGELTLLVYKSGYADNISFYQSIMPGTTRVGVVIYLSPIFSELDNKPDITVEQPNKTWTDTLIRLYKKNI